MADEPDGTLTDPADAPPEGTPETEQDPEPQAGDGSDAELRKTRREAQGLRRRIREYEESEKARKEAELTESEKAEHRIKELEKALESRDARVRESALRSEVVTAAQRLGIVDPDAAFRLLDTDGLDYDEDKAHWDGVDDALRSLAQERPWLTTLPSSGGGANPSNPSRPRSSLTIDQLKKMTLAEVQAIPQEQIDAVLSGK
jgi:hypothetical protein